MSNYLAVAAITAAFGRLLSDAVLAVPNLSAAPEVRFGRPPMDPSFVGCNLFLYRTMPSPARRNDDLATRDAGGLVVRRPQAAIDLEYIVSFYGNELALEPHRLMGCVLSRMHAQPLVTAADIRAAINGAGPHGPLAGADLDQQLQPVRFTLNPLDVDALHRVWSLFYTVPFAMSLAYTGSTLLIDADIPVVRAPPARVAHAAAVPTLGPVITEIAPPVVVFGAGSTLTVSGLRFGEGAELRFGALTVPSTRRGNALTATLPPGLPAGVNGVRVAVPSASAGMAAMESAEALFVLAPRIADGAMFRTVTERTSQLPVATILVNIAPTPSLAQTVQLFLHPQPPAPADAAASGSVTALRFAIDGTLAGSLDAGTISNELRQAFADRGLSLAGAATIAAAGRGAWRLADSEAGIFCHLARDGGHIVVHHGLAPTDPDGALAFAVGALAPADYLVSVQVGDQAAATSPLRWGRRLFEQRIAAGAGPREVLTVARTGLAAGGVTLSPNAAAVQPMPGDGWQITDGGGRTWWARIADGTLTLFTLDAGDGLFFGPSVTVTGADGGR
jgi:hypothetical protein